MHLRDWIGFSASWTRPERLGVSLTKLSGSVPCLSVAAVTELGRSWHQTWRLNKLSIQKAVSVLLYLNQSLSPPVKHSNVL